MTQTQGKVKGKVEGEEKVHSILPEEVRVKEGRHRRSFSPRKLDELANSIKLVGQLQPGICTMEDNLVTLLVGECRLRACSKLNIPFRYILKEEVVDPWLLELIELQENTHREKLPWQDEVDAKERIHKLFEAKFGQAKPGSTEGQSLRDTAEHLGESVSNFHEDYNLAVWSRNVPEVRNAPNKSTAKKIVARLIETTNREDSLDKAIERGKKSEAATIDPTSVTSEFEEQEKRLLEYDRRCLLGTMEDNLHHFKDASLDLVMFDPPWGVNFTEVKTESPTKKDYLDTEDAFRAQLGTWLAHLFGKMKEDSHLYLFFGIVHHSFVYDTLEEVGFSTNRMPLIWYKKGAHVTRNPLIWPGRSYEAIAYARKGNKPLALQGAEDVLLTPQPTPTMKDIHPSAKHPEVYRKLLIRSAYPGDSVLDPMAGSGMLAVAAESLRSSLALDWWQIEQDKDYKNLQLVNLCKGYSSITSGEATTPTTKAATESSFKKFTPGTPEWVDYWRTHPSEQEAMLAWTKKKGE